jgi:hypothetical protein
MTWISPLDRPAQVAFQREPVVAVVRIAGTKTSILLPPWRLAWAMASSAFFSASSLRAGGGSNRASPIEGVSTISRSA